MMRPFASSTMRKVMQIPDAETHPQAGGAIGANRGFRSRCCASDEQRVVPSA